MYGREVVYRGQVIGIGVGTGAVFSPLPPQNATGNWIKIVQRVPVRVSLDPEQLKKNPLRLGLSMNVAVDVHDVTGRKIPEKNTDKFIYQTDVFQIQIEGSEEVIEDILQNNGAYEDDWKTQLN
jgi:membrane fusion protein (multidrug efflux system)